jgi:hypothetical protein
MESALIESSSLGQAQWMCSQEYKLHGDLDDFVALLTLSPPAVKTQ